MAIKDFSSTVETPLELTEDPSVEQHDIIIVGAGITGINTAHILNQDLPHRKYTILEARSVIGGTWSFFKYPGFRSDSYLTTFGLKWYPWKHLSKIGRGAEITSYLEEAATHDGTMQKIHFGHRVVNIDWSSAKQKWRLEVQAGETRKTLEANFVLGCTGYYSYEKAFPVAIPGLDKFGGQVLHPQWWPEGEDCAGKHVVLIGSGATAVTMFPPLAEKAESVTMVQRSPSYVVNVETVEPIDVKIAKVLPLAWLATVMWWKDTIIESLMIFLLTTFPNWGRKELGKLLTSQVPAKVDPKVHFNPRYNPFEQRLGMCPDGDFFKALHKDNTEIVTDVIETVTNDGLLMKSGRTIKADVIITATGLYFEIFGGVMPTVDGAVIKPGDKYTWRGCMLESVPNLAFLMGYVKSSWTPGVTIMAKMTIRVIKQMERSGSTSVTPVIERTEGMPCELATPDVNSSYFVRAADRMPKCTNQGPWYGRTTLLWDTWAWMFGSVKEGLVYSKRPLGEKSQL